MSLCYLVTGGAGFIGRVLCQHLVDLGHRVVVLDNLSSGDASSLPPEVEFVLGDVCDGATVSQALQGVDGVFHLAAIASVQASLESRASASRTNLHGTVTLLERTGPRPVIYTSSAAVYGDQTVLPIPETAVLDPISPYAIDKLGSEKHLSVASRLHGARTASLRLFNVFGPGQSTDGPYCGVIARFAEEALRHGTLRIEGDGGQSRDFVHVDDVVRALWGAMALVRDRPSGTHLCMNICSGQGTSVSGLAERVRYLVGSDARIVFGSTREGDIRHSVGDPAAALALMDFAPEVSLDEGLSALISDLSGVAERRRRQPRAG